MQVNGTAFGKLADGGEAKLFTVSNKAGMEASFTNVGACTASVRVPTAAGELVDVVLGYDDASGYVAGRQLIGAVVGRVVNRIAGASFELDGVSYELSKNDGENCNHSGPSYWFTREWEVVRAEQLEDGGVVEFRLLSPIEADAYTETDEHLIPTGRAIPVDGTVLDLQDGKELGECVASKARSVVNAKGLDHNFVLVEADEGKDGFVGELRHVARLEADQTGIVLDISTDLPGMQVYTGNYLEGEVGRGGRVYHDYDAVALETNFFADAVHHPNFAQPVFGPDRPFRSRSVYAFSAY